MGSLNACEWHSLLKRVIIFHVHIISTDIYMKYVSNTSANKQKVAESSRVNNLNQNFLVNRV